MLGVDGETRKQIRSSLSTSKTLVVKIRRLSSANARWPNVRFLDRGQRGKSTHSGPLGIGSVDARLNLYRHSHYPVFYR